MYAGTRNGLLWRRRARFVLATPELIGAHELDGRDGVRMRAVVTADGAVRVDVRRAYARLASRRVSGGVLELTGELHRGGEPRLELCRRSDGRVHHYDVAVTRDGFRARIPLGDLAVAPPSLEAVVSGDPGAPEMWDVTVAGHPLGLPEALDGIDWTIGRHDIALMRTRDGDAALVTRRVVQPLALEPAGAPTAPAVLRGQSL